MALAKFEYFRVDDDGKGPVMPKEGELKLVLAWTTSMPYPGARHFWTWASYKDGKWIEDINEKELSDGPGGCLVEFWCELAQHDDLK